MTPSSSTRRRWASPAPRAAAQSPSAKAAAAQKHAGPEYEFGGPIGGLGIIFGLPAVVLLLFFGCGHDFCASGVSGVGEIPGAILTGLRTQSLWSWKAAAVVFGWTAAHFAAYLFLPGTVVEGVKLRDGTRLKYHINAHLAFWLSLLVTQGLPSLNADGKVEWTVLPLAWLYDHYLELFTASLALSCIISVYSYAASFRPGELLAEGGQTGNALYDFFIGRALNPRIGRLDLKCACELRPGLIGWCLLDLGMAAKQYELSGAVSAPMLAVCAFQALYVWDALYYEQSILTTMDITTDGFGFMLAFGDLSWVPFTYSLQARILVERDPQLSRAAMLAICAVQALGYFVFRGANLEKDLFRRDPNAAEVAHLQYIETKRGTRLLTSGWWGMARKINYTGDWIMGLAWCLCCGGLTPIAYFYSIYFAVLLIHRAVRDDHMCHGKYGTDWAVYKAKVPAVFVPGLI